MAVYIDDAFISYGRMLMCHMVADDTEELVAMVNRIGVSGKWIQNKGTPHEHFDICATKRKLAIAAGAIPVSRRDLLRKTERKLEWKG